MHSLEINTQGKSGGIWLAHIYRVHALFVFQLFYVNVAHCLKQNGILVQEKISTDLFQVELILWGVEQQFKQKLWVVRRVLYHLIT